jgi:nicotinamide phosphoribosyltransferase
LQKLDRDTQRFAYKLSEVTVAGEARAVQKTPKTDPTKASKSGRFSLVLRDGRLTTTPGDGAQGDLLETVFENGELRRTQTLDEVRKLAGREFQ